MGIMFYIEDLANAVTDAFFVALLSHVTWAFLQVTWPAMLVVTNTVKIINHAYQKCIQQSISQK